MAMFDAGLTDDEVRIVATGAAFARKFSERGDLDAEIRRARAKWTDVPRLPYGYRYKGGDIEVMVLSKDKDGNEQIDWVFFCSAVEFRAVTRRPGRQGLGTSSTHKNAGWKVEQPDRHAGNDNGLQGVFRGPL